jgi:protein ImuA
MGALTEILPAREGIGELRLVMPALARLSREGRWLVWIAPPHIPYAPALAACGVELSRVLLVYPRFEREQFWAAEQSLRSAACGACLFWSQSAHERGLRRLQLAAEAGRSWALLFRIEQAAAHASPAALRLRLSPAAGGIAVSILKRRGGWPTGPLFVEMPVKMPAPPDPREEGKDMPHRGPDVSTPDVSTPDVSTPDVSTSALHTPDVSAPDRSLQDGKGQPASEVPRRGKAGAAARLVHRQA